MTPEAGLKRGWSIIPIRLDKKPYFKLLPKGPDGKATWKPYQERQPNGDEFKSWMAANPPAFAIVTGKISDRITFDFDGEAGRQLAHQWGILPHRMTGSGGQHWDVRHPGHYVPTLNGKAKQELGRRWPGLDVKGDGGYAVAFGRNAAGPYKWLRDPEPDEPEMVPTEVWEFLRTYRSNPEAATSSKKTPHTSGRTEDSRVNQERLIRMALDQVPITGRNNAGFWLAQQLRDNRYSQSEAASAMRNYRSRVPSTNTKGERELYTEEEALASLRSAYASSPRNPWEQKSVSPATQRPVRAPQPEPEVEPPASGPGLAPELPGDFVLEVKQVPGTGKRYGWNDTGNANRLADLYGHQLIYCPERNSYYVWTGKRWQFDEFVEVEKRAEETMLEAFAEARHIKEDDKRKAFFKFVNSSLSRSGLANMIHLAKKKVGQSSVNDFDCDPWLLNTDSGTVDLKTGSLRAHRREDLVSKMIPFRYDWRAECPLFMAFLYRIMGSHPDASEREHQNAELMIRYMQKAFGCAATGVPEKILFVLYGQGNNGKTTLLEIIRDALGDKEYAGQVQVESLMIRPKEALSSNAVNTDLADLQGCRFVSSSEVEQGQRLSLSRVKYLTGLGQIKARRLRENMITFRPTYKLFLDCNHKPVISDPNDAIWNRVKCIPFKVQIPDEEIDKELHVKLRTQLSGILRWIVEGAALYHKDGLGDPPDVTAATEQYRQESDRLRDFIADRCIVSKVGDAETWRKEKCWIPAANLYPTYAAWAEATGDKHPLSKSLFDERLQKLGRKQDRVRPGGRESPQVRVWLGIRFRTPEDNEKSDPCDNFGPCDSV